MYVKTKSPFLMGTTTHNQIPPESSTEEDDPEPNVFCNVYDIVPVINKTGRCFNPRWGIYHTGIQVHGLEFSYGGHDDGSTGVFCAKPRSAEGAVFLQQVPVGHVELDPLELRQAVAEVSRQWPGNTYDPFKRNCNHFSDALCKELCGKGAPAHVNKFAKSPFIRCVFYRCVVPLGRCLERYYDRGSIVTYNDDDGVASSSSAPAEQELGISGARGMNQVLVEAATMQKLKANKLFKAGSYSDARDAYGKALGYLGTMNRRSEKDEEVCAQARKVRLVLLLNLAACDLKTENYAQAVEKCNTVLKVEPDNQKALYRRGVAQSYVGSYSEAREDLKSALQLVDAQDIATQRDIRRALQRVRDLVEGQRDRDREMAQRMILGS